MTLWLCWSRINSFVCFEAAACTVVYWTTLYTEGFSLCVSAWQIPTAEIWCETWKKDVPDDDAPTAHTRTFRPHVNTSNNGCSTPNDRTLNRLSYFDTISEKTGYVGRLILNACHRVRFWRMRVGLVINWTLFFYGRVLRINWGISYITSSTRILQSAVLLARSRSCGAHSTFVHRGRQNQ